MIERLHKEKHTIAMIGDGINDAPSLKRADVGIAMGAMGMEPAIEASDIALMSNDLGKVIFTYDVSIGTIKQNIILGLGFTHGLGMLLALLHILLLQLQKDSYCTQNSTKQVSFKQCIVYPGQRTKIF